MIKHILAGIAVALCLSCSPTHAESPGDQPSPTNGIGGVPGGSGGYDPSSAPVSTSALGIGGGGYGGTGGYDTSASSVGVGCCSTDSGQDGAGEDGGW